MNYQNSYQYPAQDVDTAEEETLGTIDNTPEPHEITAVIPESDDEVPDGDSPAHEADEDEEDGEGDETSDTVSEVISDKDDVEEMEDSDEEDDMDDKDEYEEDDDEDEESTDTVAEVTVDEDEVEAIDEEDDSGDDEADDEDEYEEDEEDEEADDEDESSETVAEVTAEEDEVEEIDEEEENADMEDVELPDIFGEMTVTTAQAAAWLRSVADAIEEGELESEPEDVGVPRKLTYKLELEQEHEGDLASLKFEIDVEIAWRFLENDNED